jgi:2-polyprenyl-6-methoxyphenol hydroxylase-like FAD-dependent oxidoreductase
MSTSNMPGTQDNAGPRISNVVVVGAGPSGILLSILLAKHGIKVDLLEATETIDEQPRAAHYAPPAVYELRRAGVIDEVIERGFKPASGCWRKANGEVIVGMRFDAIPDDPERMVVLPLDRLGKLMYAHLQKLPLATVRWGHRVVNIGEEGDKAWVEAQTVTGLVKVEGDYVIGADGATSTIRRLLFGPNSFQGETLDAAIVATNVGWFIHPRVCYLSTDISGRLSTTLVNMDIGILTILLILRTGAWWRG